MLDPWMAPLGIILGSLITYYGLQTNEEKKRRFEIKKEAYFDFLNLLEKGTILSAAEAAIKLPKPIDELKENVNNEGESKKKLAIEQVIWLNNLSKNLIMIELCGSDKIINLANRDISGMLAEFPTNVKPYAVFINELSTAIREDLLGDYSKHWYQFWK